MAYHKRYYKKRNFRKNSKKRMFSRFNTYKKRSSKAQAYQIYKLNKKVNYYYKMTKPEVQVFQPDTATIDAAIYTTTLGGREFALWRCIDHGLDVFDGRYARIKNVTFTGSFKWDGNPDSDPQQCVGCLRLLFFRSKFQRWSIPSVNDVLPANRSDFSNEYFMKCPLSRGFSTKFKLVGDYKYYLYPQKGSAKFINIKLNYPYSLRRSEDLNGDGNPVNAFPTNSLFCISYLCRTSHDATLDTFGAEIFMKLAFTDDKYSQDDQDNRHALPVVEEANPENLPNSEEEEVPDVDDKK